MSGGRYVADERGAFDLVEAAAIDPVQPEALRPPARAPLVEVAAAHDGQPTDAWAAMLYRRYGWLD